MCSSEKAAMAFQVSKTRHNSRTKHYFANPRIKIEINMTRSLEKLLLALNSSLSSCSSLHTQTHRHTDTQTNTLPYTSLAHAHRGIIIYSEFNQWLHLHKIWKLAENKQLYPIAKLKVPIVYALVLYNESINAHACTYNYNEDRLIGLCGCAKYSRIQTVDYRIPCIYTYVRTGPFFTRGS